MAKYGPKATWTDDDTTNWNRLNARLYYQQKQGTQSMKIPGADTVEDIRKALKEGNRVLIAGGPPGSFTHKISKDDRFIHLVSVSDKKLDSHYHIPPNVSVVLLNRMMPAHITSALIDQCKARHIPHYGIFKSTGTIERTLMLALVLESGTPPSQVNQAPFAMLIDKDATAVELARGYKTTPPEHAARAHAPAPEPYKNPAPPTPHPATTAATLQDEGVARQRAAAAPGVSSAHIQTIRGMFAEIRINLDLVEEEMLKVLQQQGEALKALDQLKKLREVLG